MFGWFRQYVRKVGIFGVEVEFTPLTQTPSDAPAPVASTQSAQAVREKRVGAEQSVPSLKAGGQDTYASASAPLEVPHKTPPAHSDTSYDTLVQKLVAEHSFPSHQLEVNGLVTYYVYDNKLIKIVCEWDKKNPRAYVFHKLPRNEAGTLSESDLATLDGWSQPQGMLRLALLACKPSVQMRLEDIVLIAGVPKGVSHRSSPLAGSYWILSDWEEKGVGGLFFGVSPKCTVDLACYRT